MRTPLFAFVLGALVVLPTPAIAEYWDGHFLKERLDAAQDTIPYWAGFGYVIGTADTIAGLAACIPVQPTGVQAGQVVDVVRKFLADNPDKLGATADAIVTHALASAWPCKAKEGAKSPPKTKPKPKAGAKATGESPF